MGPIIGELLPLAVGIAISPIPIIAGILMLLSPRARSTGVGFLLGWLAGIIVVTTVFTLLSSVLPEESEDSSKPVLGVVQVLLGALLVLLAVKQWRGRPRGGAEAAMPKWMQQIDGMSFVSALGLGLLLSGVNPKNLLLGASAGLSLGGADLSGGETALSVFVFTVLAGSTVLIPVMGFLLASEKLRQPLDRLRDWLQAENAVIMTVLLLVLGVVVIGKGLTAFG
ncbi:MULTISPECIES: GAP family protein [unclassified Microbacterium]|uniref:GAP family protein n=1 Tax=unclassified Microbacterium TaxID=2609290 RepID=UPI000EA953C9|nr:MULTISPECIES: GAP family protein [unclassified Microbacterium]MBT2485499.1 GAP family protein [Microbacterium sp. ISL-108]RKN68291.1 GAP family protein [Microbacterium sp. CGR2]